MNFKDDCGLFDSEDEKPKKKVKYNNSNADHLLGGSDGDDGDSDIDRPPLTEADRRRRANKQRSKVKTRLTLEEIEAFKRMNEEKKI